MRRKLILVAVLLVAGVVFFYTQCLPAWRQFAGVSSQGVVQDSPEIPYVGKALSGLKARGPVYYTYYVRDRGGYVLFSATISEADLRTWCTEQGLAWSPDGDDVNMLGRYRSYGMEDWPFSLHFTEDCPMVHGHLQYAGKRLASVRGRYRPEDGRFFIALIMWTYPGPP